MIKFSAFADEVCSNFEEQLKFLKSQNIRFIEIRFVNGKNIMDLSEKELNKVKELLESYSIGISALGSPIGKVRIDEDLEGHFDKFKHAVDIAVFLNAPLIRVFSYYAPIGGIIENFRGEVLGWMAKMADFLRNSKIVMVHENESHIYGHSAENCIDIALSVNSPNLRLAYDPANFVWGENIHNNMNVCWPVMKPFVNHIHIKDWKIGSSDIGSMPGEGDGQIPELIQELARMKYSGFVTMEPHLRIGGQFGGDTGPELFVEAIKATRNLCNIAGLKYF
ncbi:MAG: sugar phosphate isomerase/epimerase [Bacteroidales bacterium]|nr:sugar phosphate isomerase/epimerase [Bacteroidales bacterium]MCF8390124.1 sugar phosphate isomerase/epimerase [Bacteroidales bacterium]